MSDHDDPQYRAYHQPDPNRVEVRQTDDDGVFRVRMPIATTGEVRNEGDEPLTREELEGMAEQINARRPSVFLDHGANPDVAGARYSAIEVNGTWEEGAVEPRADDEFELLADARLMDPETLPESTGMLREALARIQAQAERDIPLRSSIGWRETDAAPGGVDLLEASLVGIPADPRTSTDDATLAQPRAVVMGPDEHRHLSAQQAEITTRLIDAYRDSQGNGSVENFEDWLWTVARHEFTGDEFHAAMTALEEFFRDQTPLDEPVTAQFVPFLDDQRDGDTTPDDDMSDPETQSGDGDDTDPDSDQGAPTEDLVERIDELLETNRDISDRLDNLDDRVAALEGGGDGNEADQDGDPETTQTVEVEGEELDVDELVEQHKQSLEALRQGDIDPEDVDFAQDVDFGDADDAGDGGDETTDRDESQTATGGWLQ